MLSIKFNQYLSNLTQIVLKCMNSLPFLKVWNNLTFRVLSKSSLKSFLFHLKLFISLLKLNSKAYQVKYTRFQIHRKHQWYFWVKYRNQHQKWKDRHIQSSLWNHQEERLCKLMRIFLLLSFKYLGDLRTDWQIYYRQL